MSWEKRKLGDCCLKIGSGVTPKGGASVYTNNGTALIRSQNVYNSQFSINGLVYITEEWADKMQGVSINENDVLLNITGDSVARCCVVPSYILPARVNQHVSIVRVNKDVLDSRFLMYHLTSPMMQNLLLGYASGAGATRNALTKGILEKMQVDVPPILIQKKIASILSAYNDLIENNTKRIKLLEEAAQNIYKEWFVHFRFPGHEKAKFENGLPKGWRMEPLKEYIDYKEGPGLRNWQYRDEGVPFLNIRVLDNGDINFDSIQYLSTDEVENKYKHFLLDEFDHVISTSGTLGKVVTIRKSHLPICLNTSIIRMRPKNKHIGKWYVRRLMKSDLFLNEMKSYATGSAQLNFGPKHLEMMNLLVPELYIAEVFENTIEPFELQICQLLDSNKILKEARDILLPRLMNGEIEVDATIHELEEA